MCNGVPEQKLDPDGNFRSNLGIFGKKSLPKRCGIGVWRYTCPNNDASNGLILGH